MKRRAKRDNQYSVVCQLCGKGYRAITVTHLRHAHDYPGDHPIKDYERRFGSHTAYSRETLSKLLTNIRRINRPRMWTWRELLAAIRRQYRAVQCGSPYTPDKRLVEGAWNHFGSWESAVKQAGIPFAELTKRRR